VQRQEQKAGQAMDLTRQAARETMAQFQLLLDGVVQIWWGSRVPVYWES